MMLSVMKLMQHLEGEDIVAGDLLACLRERGPVSRLKKISIEQLYSESKQ